MGMRCDKIVGYGIDIQEPWEELREELQDKWMDADMENLNFKGYNIYKGENDTLTIIYDGLSGEYCKLMYITAYEKNSYEEETNIDTGINKILSTAEVPFSVKQKVKELYKEIFKKDLNRTSLIKALYLVHWH